MRTFVAVALTGVAISLSACVYIEHEKPAPVIKSAPAVVAPSPAVVVRP